MTADSYTSCDQLVEATELADVRFYEVHGQRNAAAPPDGTWSIRVLTNQVATELQLRFRVEVSGAGASYTADAAAVYTLQEAKEVPPDLVREFAERVGIFAAFPYLRSSIGNLAAQLGVDRPVLPMLRQGMVRLSPENPE